MLTSPFPHPAPSRTPRRVTDPIQDRVGHGGLQLGPALAGGFAVALSASVALGAAMPSGAPGAYVTLGALLFVWCALSRPAAAAPLTVLWFLCSTGFVTDRHGVLGWHGTADEVLLGAYLLVAAAAAVSSRAARGRSRGPVR